MRSGNLIFNRFKTYESGLICRDDIIFRMDKQINRIDANRIVAALITMQNIFRVINRRIS